MDLWTKWPSHSHAAYSGVHRKHILLWCPLFGQDLGTHFIKCWRGRLESLKAPGESGQKLTGAISGATTHGLPSSYNVFPCLASCSTIVGLGKPSSRAEGHLPYCPFFQSLLSRWGRSCQEAFSKFNWILHLGFWQQWPPWTFGDEGMVLNLLGI